MAATEHIQEASRSHHTQLADETNLTIGQLAKKVGLGAETLRFYEREGLLPEPHRTASNYRKYGQDAVARLRFIRRAKDLGFTLQEIRKLLRLSANSHSDAGDFKAAAEEKIHWIDERIRELSEMRSVLAQAVEACPGHGDKAQCPVLALFVESEGHDA